MSAEKIVSSAKINHSVLMSPKLIVQKSLGRVDINNLFARFRKEERRESKKNFIYFFLFSLSILILGTIISF